jgi:hypothetical protein
MFLRTLSVDLSKLTTDGTSKVRSSVRVGEETTRVRDDLLDVEAGTSVGGGSSGVNASGEWASQAAVRNATLIRSGRVREGQARRTGRTFDTLVDVGSGLCGGRVVASHAAQCDVLFGED